MEIVENYQDCDVCYNENQILLFFSLFGIGVEKVEINYEENCNGGIKN